MKSLGKVLEYPFREPMPVRINGAFRFVAAQIVLELEGFLDHVD